MNHRVPPRASRLVPATAFKLVARALAVATLVLGCDSPTAPQPGTGAMGRVAVFANTAGTGVTSIVIRVTGPGIVKANGTTPDTLTFNLPMNAGVASGSIDVPAGPSREFMVSAYNDATETHRGNLTTNIATGANPTVTITLFPITGSVPITMSIGSLLVMVQPDSVYVGLGDTLRATAQVRDQNNNVVSGGVIWGSSNAARATIDTSGLITVRDTGVVWIIATRGGVSGMARIYGKRFPATTTSYQLTWDGSKNRNWSDTANWTAQNGVAPRVPTPADSVVIPFGIFNQPLLDACAVAATVRDIVMEPGTTLGQSGSCGGSLVLRVYGRARVENVVNLTVEAQTGARLAGAYGTLRIPGDSVRLAGRATATQLDVHGGGRLMLAGNAIVVSANVTLRDSAGLVMTNAADTLNVRGDVTVGHNTRNTLSAGVLRAGATFVGSAVGYRPTGTHTTVFDNATGQTAYVNGSGKATWPNVRVANPTSVNFYVQTGDTLELTGFRVDSTRAQVQTATWTGADKVRIIPAGGTLALGLGGLYAGAQTVIVDGNVTLPAKPAGATSTPTINGQTLVVRGGTLTVGDSAVVNPSNLHMRGGVIAGRVAAGMTTLFEGTQQPIGPGTARFDGGVTLRDSSRLVVGTGTAFVGGALMVSDSAGVEMTDAADTLSVRGDVTMGHNARNTLSAGVLRAGATFVGSAVGYRPSGTHATIFDNPTAAQTAYANGTGKATWTNVRVANPTYVNFYVQTGDTLELTGFRVDSTRAQVQTATWTGADKVRIIPAGGTLALGLGGLYAGAQTVIVDGSVTLPAKPAGATSTPTINGQILIVRGGSLTVGDSALVNPSNLQMRGGVIAGRVAAGMTTLFEGTRQPIGPGAARFDGGLTLRDSSRLVVGTGTAFVGGALMVSDSAGVEMTDAADTLSVRGDVTMGHNARNTLSAGVLRAGATFAGSATGYRPTGTHATIFDNPTAAQTAYANGSGKATWTNVRVANPTYVNFYVQTGDTLELTGFRVDSARAQVQTATWTGADKVRIIPAGGTLALGLGGLYAGAQSVIVDGNVTLPAKPAGATSTPTINGQSLTLRNGSLTIGAGSLVNPGHVIVDSGAVAGTTNAGTTTLRNTHQVIAPGIAAFNGNLVLQDTSRLIVGSGRSTVTGGLQLQEWSGLEMTDAADTLSVRGDLTVGHNTRNTLTAGVVRSGATFVGSATGWRPTGSHILIFDNATTAQTAYANGTGKAVWPNVRVANPTYVNFYPQMGDTLELPNFRVDSTRAQVQTATWTGSDRVRITPQGGTLALGLGGMHVGAVEVIVVGNVTLPAKPAGATATPTISGNRLTVHGGVTTGAGTLLNGTIRLTGAIAFGGTHNTLNLEMAGVDQVIPRGLGYGSLTVRGRALVQANDTLMFNNSGHIFANADTTGRLDVAAGAYVQFGRTAGVGFSMSTGSQLNNSGVIRYTASGTWTTPAGVSVIGNPPASTSPAYVQVITPPEASGFADSALTTMPLVRVIDALSYPLKGVTVTFTPRSGGSQLTGVTVVTDTNGYARLGTWKLGPTETQNTIEASVSGATSAFMSVQAYYTRRLSMGANSACATANAGTVHCWGDARAWQFGAAATAFGGGSDTAFKVPMLTALASYGRSTTGFGDHLCAIDNAGLATCWGKGGQGQLGGGALGDANGNAPVTVAGGITWAEISRGPTATCGVSTSGTGYCWGLNRGGMLGIGSSDTTLVHHTPQQVSGAITFRSIAVGYNHACGITTGGTTYCWGNNSQGQIGDQTATTRTVPTVISVPGGATHPGAAVQVAVGNMHSCIVSSQKKVWCWGVGNGGQIGDGAQVTRYYPREVPAPGGSPFTQVTAGNGFTCALQDDGKPYCWGVNNVGQLGEGTSFTRTLPTVVGGSAKFNAIAAGDSHVCGNRGGTVFCWGAAGLGQVGYNSTLNANFPMRVSSPF